MLFFSRFSGEPKADVEGETPMTGKVQKIIILFQLFFSVSSSVTLVFHSMSASCLPTKRKKAPVLQA